MSIYETIFTTKIDSIHFFCVKELHSRWAANERTDQLFRLAAATLRPALTALRLRADYVTTPCSLTLPSCYVAFVFIIQLNTKEQGGIVFISCNNAAVIYRQNYSMRGSVVFFFSFFFF